MKFGKKSREDRYHFRIYRDRDGFRFSLEDNEGNNFMESSYFENMHKLIQVINVLTSWEYKIGIKNEIPK